MNNLLKTLMVVTAMAMATTTAVADIVRGDIDGDGSVSIQDVTTLINYLLTGDWGDEPIPTATEVITANGVSFKMVKVDGGTFSMGASTDTDPDAAFNEGPVHEVTVWDYYIGQIPVTQELWLAVMGENPSLCQGDLQRPVENVSRFDCAIFVDKLTELTGKIFRMPTEAEWEYAARGGSKSQGFRFAGSNTANTVAWFSDNANGSTQPVAALRANELGLFDMSGNVAEWCEDFYALYDSEPQVNPNGPESGYEGIVRGGSYTDDAARCRVASRGVVLPSYRSANVGLRLVMNP